MAKFLIKYKKIKYYGYDAATISLGKDEYFLLSNGLLFEPFMPIMMMASEDYCDGYIEIGGDTEVNYSQYKKDTVGEYLHLFKNFITDNLWIIHKNDYETIAYTQNDLKEWCVSENMKDYIENDSCLIYYGILRFDKK